MTDLETNGLQIVARISEICRKKGIVRKEVSDALKLPDNCFSNWSARGTVPAGDICIRIADYLKVSAVWLITGKEEGLSNEEEKLLSIYQKLSPEQKDTIWTLMEKWESEIEIREDAEREA